MVFVVVCACIAAFASETVAAIAVDPGTAGSSSDNLSIPFTDLNGTSLLGQHLDLEFVFSDGKYLEYTQGLDDPQYQLSLRLWRAKSVDETTSPPLPTGYLTDGSGNPLDPLPDSPGVSRNSTLLTYGLTYLPGSLNQLDGTMFHGVNWDIDLPNTPAVQITDASLIFRIPGGSNDDLGTTTVGQHTGMPEPHSACTWLLLAGLALMGRRRR